VLFRIPQKQSASQPLTLISLSSAPVARYFPSGLKHKLRIYKSPKFGANSSTSTLYIKERRVHRRSQLHRRHNKIDKGEKSSPGLRPRLRIVNLRGAVTPCCDIFTICGEADAAYDTVSGSVREGNINGEQERGREKRATRLSCLSVCMRLTSSSRRGACFPNTANQSGSYDVGVLCSVSVAYFL
jgi:hypothetical protein